MSRAAPTIERVWLTYLACVVIVALATPADGEGHDVASFLLLHAPVLAVVAFCAFVVRRRGPAAARLPRSVLAVAGLPVVFSALCFVLPHAHPEPYEYTWLQLDRALFGSDCAVLFADLPAWVVEVLQWDYAAFYGICIGSVLLAGACSGGAAMDRALLLIVGGFLMSYLGYLLVPTIAPKLVFDGLEELRGVWATPTLRAWIDGAEANHWDCFPSGHTWLTITSLVILRRWARPWFRVLLVPGLLLIASTVLLRYHWCADVAAGALLAWPCARLCDRLADVDGWPTAEAQVSTK